MKKNILTIITLIVIGIILCIVFLCSLYSRLNICQSGIERIEISVDFNKVGVLGWDNNVKIITDAHEIEKYVKACNEMKIAPSTFRNLPESAFDKIRIFYEDNTYNELVFKDEILCVNYCKSTDSGVHLLKKSDFYKIEKNAFDELLSQ